jgi:DNA transformation protein
MAKPLEPNISNLIDRLTPIGDVRARRMFGGYGIFEGGLMFALVADDIVYFKTDAACQAVFEAVDSEPFVYVAKGRPVRMSYWRCPVAAETDPHLLVHYASIALAAARRVQESKPRRADRD